jgi:hypothetical protein
VVAGRRKLWFVPPKQRQIRMEQRGGLAAMQELESRTDDELERETRHRAAARAILGARAADRYDSVKARAFFKEAIAAARPQERMQLRRMADASLALADRRAGDLKDAVERLGQEAPTGRQLMLLRFMGLVAPPAGTGILRRMRGIAIIIAIVIVLVAVGFGLAKLVTLPFGGISTAGAVFLGLVIILIVLGVMALLGRRRQKAAQAKARAARGGG